MSIYLKGREIAMTKLNAKVGGIKITHHIFFYEHCIKIFSEIWNMNSLKRYSDLLLSTEDISPYIVGQRGQGNNKKAESVWLVMK